MTNVVVVHTDDTGRHVAPYGYDVATPALDAVADRGVVFGNAHAAAPTCSPSRTALMTGQSPHRAGMIGLAHRGFSLAEPGRHLAAHLSAHGVETVLAGQQHEAGDGPDDDSTARSDSAEAVLGYDRVLEGDESGVDPPFDHQHTRRDLATAAAAAEFVRERDPEAPFFLSVGLDNTHKPFPQDQTAVDPDHVRPPAPLPDVRPVREEVAAFQAAVGVVDDCLGSVVDALADAGLAEDTLLLFTTDHGPPFPRMKCTLTDAGTGIALLADFPDRAPRADDGSGDHDPYRRGTREDALVSNLDVYPTVCKILDVAVPAATAGRSLLPLAEGTADSIRDVVFGEITYHAAYEPVRSVRTDRYLYVRRFADDLRTVGANVDDGPTKTFLSDRGLLGHTPPREALYDTHLDPTERENLVDDPPYGEVRESLAERLDAWMERTEDPLRDGPVSKPPGAWADSREATRPDAGDREPDDAR